MKKYETAFLNETDSLLFPFQKQLPGREKEVLFLMAICGVLSLWPHPNQSELTLLLQITPTFTIDISSTGLHSFL